MSSNALIKNDENEISSVEYTEIKDDFVSALNSYGDSIKKAVLVLAGEGNFEAAKRELKFYQQANQSTPGFDIRTRHYFSHCMEVLDAIDNLKNFPNFSNLRAAQQKQIRERVSTYAADLSSILGRIDKVNNDLKIQDIRSTLWVVRSFWTAFIIIFATLAAKEAYYTLPQPGNIVDQVIDILFTSVGL